MAYGMNCQRGVTRIISYSHLNTCVLICLCDQDEACVIWLGKIVSVTDKQDKLISLDNNFSCRYAGILLGITNSFATIPGMVGPVIAKSLTHNVSPFTFFIFFSVTIFIISVECQFCLLKSVVIKWNLGYTCKFCYCEQLNLDQKNKDTVKDLCGALKFSDSALIFSWNKMYIFMALWIHSRLKPIRQDSCGIIVAK